MYSTGKIQQLCTVDIDMVKEISLCTSLSLGKPSYLSKDRGPLLGQSIFSANGLFWSHQRKIIAPEFYMDKVKVNIYFFLSFLSWCTNLRLMVFLLEHGEPNGGLYNHIGKIVGEQN